MGHAFLKKGSDVVLSEHYNYICTLLIYLYRYNYSATSLPLLRGFLKSFKCIA